MNEVSSLRLRRANNTGVSAEGKNLATQDLDRLSDQQLADAIDHRSQVVAKWKKIYWDEFIPFAHGVRRLATYYNDAVRPADPYEFVGLLRNQPLLAAQRNGAIGELAQQLASNASLCAAVQALLSKHAGSLQWPTFRDELARVFGGAADFIRGFDDLNDRFLDVAYDQERLHERSEPLLRNIVELSQDSSQLTGDHSSQTKLFRTWRNNCSTPSAKNDTSRRWS